MIGDTASLDQDGRPLPGVAQVAMQQGRYVGRAIRRRVKGKPAADRVRSATSTRAAWPSWARDSRCCRVGRLRIPGIVAWLAWAGIHLEFLGRSSLRLSVFLQWVWTYWTGQRGSQLIVAHRASEPSPAAPTRAAAPLLRAREVFKRWKGTPPSA